MKLVVAIVRDSDALAVTDALVEQQYRVTRIASTGGFMRRGNVTLLLGLEDTALDEVFKVIEKACGAAEPGQHKATIFVLPAEDFVQIG